MDSKKQKVIAIAVVAIIILAGAAFLLLTRKPEPTLAERLAIGPTDVNGTEWWTYGGTLPQFLNISSVNSHQLAYFFDEPAEVNLEIIVFNTSNDCLAYFDQSYSYYSLNASGWGVGMQNISLGDLGYVLNESAVVGCHFNFIRENVYVWLDLHTPSSAPSDSATVFNLGYEIAKVQDSKIQSYFSK